MSGPSPAPGGAAAPSQFDVCGPLPSGVTVLEASAGTGKTYTIAALAARYVAKGVPLERLLLVTFTRMATGELRHRVRQRLVTAEAGLARALDGHPPDPEDEVLCLLAAGSTADVARRRQFLERALSNFDAATIATIHQFCQHVLSSLGVAADVERGAAFVDDISDLIREAVDDLYVQHFHDLAGDPATSRTQAFEIGRTAMAHPLAPIEPQGLDGSSTLGLRSILAGQVRREVEARKGRSAVITYDDFLIRLLHTLENPHTGPAACGRLRARYEVALVDEFQDTDPVQWGIFRRAFAAAGSTLVLIGDPKQAVYAFRGADVYSYLEAAGAATRRATLSVNWRSDQGLIDAYDALFGGVKLGHPEIAYRTVEAAPHHQQPRLEGAPEVAPLRIRMVHREDRLVEVTAARGWIAMPSALRHVAEDLAGDVVRLLSSKPTIETRRADGSTEAERRLEPGDVAVLVRKNNHAAFVRDALEAAGVQAVINGAGSVFATNPAFEWLRFLEALERPTSLGRARSAALTDFVGWSAARIASAGETEWGDLHDKLHRWAGILRWRGVASLLEAVTHIEGLPGRVLARLDGERDLTDLRHIGQLLHAAASADKLGTSALTAWLAERIGEAHADTNNEERSRRLESDADAVQVLTIHRAKGLEFPVVYCPYLWDIPPAKKGFPVVFHDPAAGEERTVDVGLEGPAYDAHYDQAVTEDRGEELRLAYVALTRAQHQAVIWWAATYECHNSALGRLLFACDADGNVAAAGTAPPADDAAAARFAQLAAAAPPGRIAMERSTGWDGIRWAGRPRTAGLLEAGRFERALDRLWRRTSYTAITAAAGHAGPRVASEPEETATVDEPPLEGAGAVAGAGTALAAGGSGAGAGALAGAALAGGGTVGAAGSEEEAALRAVAIPLAAMRGGAAVGTFVHRVLEHADFTAADLVAELAAGLTREQARRSLDLGDPAMVIAGLRAAIETPLGPLVGDLRLRDVARRDRGDELVFELPLVGGDAPVGSAQLTPSAIAALLEAHLPPGDPLAGYPERLRDPALATGLRGYLSGSLDAVLRVRGGDVAHTRLSAQDADNRGVSRPAVPDRFAVVDYKTNRLGGGGGAALSAWDYRPAALAEAMQRAHYPLQALLYTVALHRYLRWRLAGYDPEVNLAGALYLFLRGMTGAGGPCVGGEPCGVFAWRPPTALVVALSDLFDQGAAA